MSDPLRVALKEWAATCRALESGRQMILLRKGGISERSGEFELEHRRFLLFPTFLHQNRSMLKPQFHRDLDERTSEPDRIELRSLAEVSHIAHLRDRAQMRAIDHEHIWTTELIDFRFDYRPENPLYLLVVRTHLLAAPATIPNTPTYGGCRSWVPLDSAIDVSNVKPAIAETQFEHRRRRIIEALACEMKHR